jgi:hypothetical protein
LTYGRGRITPQEQQLRDGVKPQPLEKNEQGRNCNGKWRLSPDNQEVFVSSEGGDSIAPHKHVCFGCLQEILISYSFEI